MIEDEIKEQCLRDREHQRNMEEDKDYFCEWTCENLQLIGNNLYLFEVMPQLEKWCGKFDNEVSANDVLEWMKMGE